MAAEISESLKQELSIVELESEFRDHKPLSKPRKTWLVITIVGLFLLFALFSWRNDIMALTIFFLLGSALQLVEYQASKRANKLYECGTEIIEYYKTKCKPRT